MLRVSVVIKSKSGEDAILCHLPQLWGLTIMGTVPPPIGDRPREGYREVNRGQTREGYYDGGDSPPQTGGRPQCRAADPIFRPPFVIAIFYSQIRDNKPCRFHR